MLILQIFYLSKNCLKFKIILERFTFLLIDSIKLVWNLELCDIYTHYDWFLRPKPKSLNLHRFCLHKNYYEFNYFLHSCWELIIYLLIFKWIFMFFILIFLC